MRELIKKKANDLYEWYERDYKDFTNSRIRAMEYCRKQIWNPNIPEGDKLFWLEVKEELRKKY